MQYFWYFTVVSCFLVIVHMENGMAVELDNLIKILGTLPLGDMMIVVLASQDKWNHVS